jgi:hypothetical protein
MKLFKLIGATENRVADDWEHKEPHIFTEIRFPWNKPPTNVWSPCQVIIYTVGSGALIATQEVAGPPSIKPRRGPAGSRDNRWPHEIEVKTLYYCSPLSAAPELRDVSPEFADKYRKRFRNGSHWQITDEEYDLLASAVEDAGRPFSSRP